MKRLLSVMCFVLSMSVILLQAQTVYTVKTIPNPKTEYGGLVSDPASTLNSADKERINNALTALESSLTVQFAVVVVPSIGQENIDDFANRLFAEWGIGHKENDNGLLLMLVMDQRAWRIETGYGMEGVLPDAVCSMLGRDILVPHLKNRQYGEGIFQVVNNISNILSDPSAANEVRAKVQAENTTGNVNYPGLILFLAIFLLLCLIVVYFFRRSLKKLANDSLDPYMKYKNIRKLWVYVFGSAVFIFLPLVFLFIILMLRRRFRYQPRVSASGKPMTLLDEKEDDLFLSAGQLVEERVKSIDYDVWVTADRSEHLILAYDKFSTAFKVCQKCSFKTNSRIGTYILTHATTEHSGTAIDTYLCEHCHAQTKKERTIPRVSQSSSSGGKSSSGSRSSSFGGGRSGGGGSSGRW